MANRALRSNPVDSHQFPASAEPVWRTKAVSLPKTAQQLHTSFDNYPISQPGVMLSPHQIDERTCNGSQFKSNSTIDPALSIQAGFALGHYYSSTGLGLPTESAVAQYLDKNLRSEPGYRPPIQSRDFITPKPAKTKLRWKTTPWQDLVERTPEIKAPGPNLENDPLVYSFLPGTDPMEDMQASYVPFPVTPLGSSRDISCLSYQTPPKAFHSAPQETSQDPIFTGIYAGYSLQRHGPSSRPQRLSSHQNVTSHRCIECTLARTKCERIAGKPWLPCRRCTRLSIFKSQVKTASDYVDFIGYVVVLDVGLTQVLLSDLRDEAGQLTGLEQGLSLEDVFDGTMFCHMTYLTGPNSNRKFGVPVVISHLATTRKAKAAAGDCSIPPPALDARQMDTFIDLGNRLSDLESLQPVERNIIVAAFRCSACLGFLFNWNQNSIYYEEGRRGASIPQAKNLVLETVFSIAYRVEELIKLLSFEVIKSLTEPENPNHDPGTISCALWIVYSSLNTFSELKWEAKSLQNLKRFLNELHRRAPAALTALQRYRQEVAFKRCGEFSPHLKTFKKHVYEQKVPQSLISLTYERQTDLITLPTYSPPQSYTDVLEANVFDATLGILVTKNIPRNHSPAYSTITLEELQKRDGTLTRGSKGGSMKTYSGSVASESSSTYDDVPPLTMKTTIKDSETGLDAEISRVKTHLSHLRYLKGLTTARKSSQHDLVVLEPVQPPIGVGSQFATDKTTVMEEAIVLESARPKQQLGRQKKKRAPSSVTSKTPTAASGSSSRRSPRPKRQRRSPPKTCGAIDASLDLEFGGIPYLGEVPDVEDGGFASFFLDHRFNLDFIRND